ncbi:MAG: methyltransferase, partial [Chloroflexi bacterium]|nr:methyltransferase [Chloroflexota bacterium]
VGCGVGVLGLSLQKATPSAQVVLQDRDALAVAFTQMNAQLNGLEQATVRGELGVGNGRYDLIVSNLPGKAGEPVLQQMLGEIVASLSENGRSAIVIVNPLAALIHTTLQQLGCDILLQERGKMHTVFHFSGGEFELEAGDLLRPYIRGQYPFKAAKFSVTLQTTYGLPEFDTVGYHSSLTINLLNKLPTTGRVLMWNPGQGLVPLYLHRKRRSPIDHFTLAGRDLLSLNVAATNLQAHGLRDDQLQVAHLPDLQAVSGQYDWIICFPDVDAGVKWETAVPAHINQLLTPGGYAIVTTKSAFIHRILEQRGTLLKKQDKKKKGYRLALLQKPK